jgi:hypothetical protein
MRRLGLGVRTRTPIRTGTHLRQCARVYCEDTCACAYVCARVCLPKYSRVPVRMPVSCLDDGVDWA